MRGGRPGRSGRGRLTAVSLALVTALTACAAAPAFAVRPAFAIPPTSPDCKPPQTHRLIPEAPWHLRRYAPQRIWPLTNGAGVTVAVIDSGVDGAHPQLQGRVDAGKDFLDNQPTAGFDCVGHGTAVASIIAGVPRNGIGFSGIAPGVRILPIRVSERILVDSTERQGASVNFAELARAITYAVDQGARVINLSLYHFTDDKQVRDAIADARRRDVVIVAAVGNSHNQAGGEKDRTPYPAAYDGVIGVGAIDENGVRVPESQVGPFVDLVAPGANVTVAANRSADHWVVEGTSFAAPHVAAAAALLRSRWPTMKADQVVRRLLATADPARGGPRSDGYGAGEVDPYRAVNETHASGTPQRAEPLPVNRQERAAAQAAARARVQRVAGWLTGGALLLTALIFVLAWILPKGRGRRWRPGATPVSTPAEAAEAGMYSWSLGPAPALAHPDRAVTEEFARELRQRR